MFDGIKILDLSVVVDLLLQHDRLTFGTLVDIQAGAVLDQRQKATDRGLTFKLIPSTTNSQATSKGSRYRVELVGSLHRYGRGGLHNADDFTADNLFTAVEELISTYQIDPVLSVLNNIEFGVNLKLPYPVADLLRALICYHGMPFERHTENGFSYYQATLQRYAVKIYDKGEQYGLPDEVVRFEIKVLKMQHLHGRGILIKTLDDLLNPVYYPSLGQLLADTFNGILFDEPLLSLDHVPTRDRELLLRGRNPRYWQLSEGVTGKEYDRQQKSLKREEVRFRKLLADHRPGVNWQHETAALLLAKWEELTVPNRELTDLSDRETLTTPGRKCPKLTDLSEGSKTGHLSEINPLYVPLISDNEVSGTGPVLSDRGTLQNESVVCPVTGVPLTSSTAAGGRAVRRFVSATMLRTNAGLMLELSGRFGKYAKGSKEDEPTRTAHNVRNTFNNPRNNPRNNLKRSIENSLRQPTLFGVVEMIKLSDDKRDLLGDWWIERTRPAC